MKVLILMGSDSDITVMEGAAEVLDEYGIKYAMTVASAHRTPERVRKLVKDAEKKGAQAIICGGWHGRSPGRGSGGRDRAAGHRRAA